ncbi:MAG: hypothetical protein ACRD3H_16880 [Terriglobales bacterium]|jgi:hypothetical protein|nr:hypothetical protein [Terriglobales bacterium]
MHLSPTALLTSLPIPASWLQSASRLRLLPAMLFDELDKKGDVYSILWALVFGFATLNILGLVAKRFEPSSRNRLNFGETLAILVVVVSIILLGWEMLNLFKIFPIKLHPHD